ncbi:MAG: hypothetical protein OSB41_14930 [Kiritimatiellae bacterium]|nr:hypothetical protein [Kiritimatiellia bacterium]
MVGFTTNTKTGLTRLRFDFATISVVLMWVGVWLCWPHVDAKAHVRTPNPSTITYGDLASGSLTMIREPLLFLRFPHSDEPILDDDVSAEYDAFTASRPLRSVVLPSAHGPSSMFDLNRVLQGRGHGLQESYRPRWDDTPAFVLAQSPAAGIVVTLSARLRGVGLALDIEPDTQKRFSDSPWHAVIEISSRDGISVDDAFVIESSGDTELDLWLVRQVQGLHATAALPSWRGQVNIVHTME